MEGSVDVRDSWEVADLDESMSRLLVSSRKSPASLPSRELAEEATPPAVSASQVAAASSGRRGVVLEDAVSQVDGFLREALEKPRERLSSKASWNSLVLSSQSGMQLGLGLIELVSEKKTFFFPPLLTMLEVSFFL